MNIIVKNISCSYWERSIGPRLLLSVIFVTRFKTKSFYWIDVLRFLLVFKRCRKHEVQVRVRSLLPSSELVFQGSFNSF